MKTTCVNKTSAEVAEYNAKYSLLIECGMMEHWTQSEIAAKREERDKAAAEREAKQKEVFEKCKATVNKLATEIAADHGLRLNTPLSTYAHYKTHSYGTVDGIEVSVSHKTRIYKINKKTGELNTGSLIKMLNDHFEHLARKLKIEAETKRRVEAAKNMLPLEILNAVAKLIGKPSSDLTAKLRDDGKISISYTHYPSSYGRNRHASPYPIDIFTPTTVENWKKWIELKTKFNEDMAALTAEAKA